MKKWVCNIVGIVLAEKNKIFQWKPVQTPLSPPKKKKASGIYCYRNRISKARVQVRLGCQVRLGYV
jgi:hypothetical protein